MHHTSYRKNTTLAALAVYNMSKYYGYFLYPPVGQLIDKSDPNVTLINSYSVRNKLR